MDIQNLKKAVADYNRKVAGGPPALVALRGLAVATVATIGGLLGLIKAGMEEWPGGHYSSSLGWSTPSSHPGAALMWLGGSIMAGLLTVHIIKRLRDLDTKLINLDGGREDEAHQKGTRVINIAGAGYKLPAPAGALRIAGVPLPAGVEQQHILLAGAPGSGKSEALKALVATVRERGSDGAVIHDPTGEMVSLFYSPERGDMIINPLDARHANWDLWADMRPGEEANLAKAVIPSAQGDNKYFSDAAQALLEVLLQQTRNIDDLVKAGLGESPNELADRLYNAGLGGLVGNAKTFGSVRGNLAPYLRSLALLPPIPAGHSPISLEEFCEKPRGRFVFLLTKRRNKDALRPIHQLFLTQLVNTALSLRPDPSRRIWLFMDELPELLPSDAIATSLSQGRKFGLSTVMALQAVGQMYDRTGQHEAAALLSMPKSRLILRVGDGESAELMSKEIGDRQIKRKQESQNNSGSPGGQNFSVSTSTTWQTTTERAVLASEIMALPDLTGYLRIEDTTMRVEMKYTPRTASQPDYEPVPPRPLPVAEKKSETEEADNG
jgi:hypothetical protein